MTYIMTDFVRISESSIDMWECEMIQVDRKPWLNINAFIEKDQAISTGTHLEYDTSSYEKSFVTSLAVEAIDYMIAAAKQEDTHCHINEIGSLIIEAVSYLEGSKCKQEGSLDYVSCKILTSPSGARVVFPGMNTKLTRIEAYMALKSMYINEPMAIKVIEYLPAVKTEIVTYSPEKNMEQK